MPSFWIAVTASASSDGEGGAEASGSISTVATGPTRAAAATRAARSCASAAVTGSTRYNCVGTPPPVMLDRHLSSRAWILPRREWKETVQTPARGLRRRGGLSGQIKAET